MELTTCRPGGLELTRLGLEFCQFTPAARLLDIGCGAGATVALLTNLGYQAIGVDLLPTENGIQADAAALPFDDDSFDGILFECSFSKITTADTALSEAHRVLKPNGKLLMTDFYARGQPAEFSGVLGRMESQIAILQRLQSVGFRTIIWQDHSETLPQFWGQWILDQGSQQVGRTIDKTTLRQAKCGYFLAVWEGKS